MYTAADLVLGDLTSIQRGIAWARFLLRDTRDPPTYHDVELAALLTASAVAYDGARYYRPHFVAATLIRTDPNRAISESIDNASKTKPDPDTVADRMMLAYEFIDDLINLVTGYEPSRTFEAIL